MAVYKVPQDVEADDKLLGPFSFKQFVFILITIGTLYVAYILFTINPFLVVIPLPFSFFFGMLGLWPRKDQPVEVYLAAIIRFWLKPRKRIWNQEGHLELVQITAPKVDTKTYTDGLSKKEVKSRLKVLASTMDTRGWDSKNIGVDEAASYIGGGVAQSDRLAMPQVSGPLVAEPAGIGQSEDVLDDTNSNPVATHFDKLSQASTKHAREEAIETMHKAQQAQSSAAPEPQKTQSYVQQTDDEDEDQKPEFRAYPEIHQSVISPSGSDKELGQKTEETQAMTEEQSAAILDLANNSDLNVSTIARQAEKALESDDVINLH